MLETAVVEAPSADELGDNNEAWIEALPARVYHTPQYGAVPITPDKLERFIHNFRQNVRGQDIATDYEHGVDSSKGLQASGWYRDFDIRPSSDDPTQQSLYAKVKFTDDAVKDIKDGKYKYWSLEWDDEYVTDQGHVVPDVVLGGGLTNRPVAKRTMPINFSEGMWNELDEDTRKQFAVLTSKQRDALPASAFLYVEKDGTKHLPYRSADGSLDMVHLRAAITRLSQSATGTVDGESWLTDSLRASLLAKARRLLAGSKKASELVDRLKTDNETSKLIHDLFSETAAWEHSDPGVVAPLYGTANSQPDPGFGQFVARQTGDVSQDDLSVSGGWRREPLPVISAEGSASQDPIEQQESRQSSGDEPSNVFSMYMEGGKTMQLNEQQSAELVTLLGVESDDPDKFMESAKTAFSELKQFKDAVGTSAQEKEFSEQFPHVWKEHQELLERDRTNAATTFAESVQRVIRVTGKNDDDTPKFEPTRNSLSGLALSEVAEAHKKFSEGTGTLEDFESAVKTIMNGGIVQFGEEGSSVEPEQPVADATTAQGRAGARRLFAEKVAEVVADHAKKNDGAKLDYMAAVSKASTMYPELAEAYRATA